MKPDHNPGLPRIYPTHFTLMPKNLGLPPSYYSWTTWKFGELFYSHYKTYKQFKRITAIFKWMSAMFKIHTVIFMNRLVDLHPRTHLLRLANKENLLNDLVSSDLRCEGTLLRCTACDLVFNGIKFSGSAPARATLDFPGSGFFASQELLKKGWATNHFVACHPDSSESCLLKDL